MRKYSFSQKKITEYSCLVNASSVNMSKNKIYRYPIRARYTQMKNSYMFNKQMASLTICHMAILLKFIH